MLLLDSKSHVARFLDDARRLMEPPMTDGEYTIAERVISDSWNLESALQGLRTAIPNFDQRCRNYIYSQHLLPRRK